MGGGRGKEAACCECYADFTHIKAPLHSNASTTSYAPKHLHYAQKCSLQTHGGDACERPALCQMVHDAGMRYGAKDHLQTVFATQLVDGRRRRQL